MLKGVCIDLSGTIHIESTLTRQAKEGILKLIESGLQVRFVTNTTKESSESLLKKLHSLGLSFIRRDQVFSSLSATRSLIIRENLRPLLLVSKEAVPEFSDIRNCATFPVSADALENINSVVVGLAPELFAYEPLTTAMRILLNDSAQFIAIHKGKYFQRSDGLALGPGPFVNALEYATGKKATLVGKPEQSFFQIALRDMNLLPHEVAMIGDDVTDDVGGAMNIGMFGILVKTGKYRKGDEETKGVTPNLVATDFAEAVDRIISKFIA